MTQQGISLQDSIIDSDFHGEITVSLRNDTSLPITINPGDKVAQFIFERATTPCIRVTNIVRHSQQNQGGFGTVVDNKPGRVETFRISPDEVLLVDTNNYKHPRLRRVNTRNYVSFVTDASSPGTDNSPTEPTDAPSTSITHHLLDSKEKTPVDPALHQTVPTIDPTHHKQSPTTSQDATPIPLPVDRVNSALPQAITMSIDVLQKSIGFLSSKPLLKHLASIGDMSLKIPTFSDNPSLDPGTTASIKSSRRNTSPSKLPNNYSDVWHLDIGFGPCTAIGGIRYTLMAVDKSSHFKLVYGLKNLTTSLHTAIEQFLIDCGKTPKIIRTDFDTKIIAGRTKDILTAHNIKIQAAPPHRQHQNGLVERA